MSRPPLPSVDRLARSLQSDLPWRVTVDIARTAIGVARDNPDGPGADAVAADMIEAVRRSRPTGVINATGVLLHTNLGRAPLSATAVDAMATAARGYSNLEFDLDDGTRGTRGGYALQLLQTLTGAPAAMVVNNNAGALFLTLLALGGSVPVSRGELIEIGGSYRLPDLMTASGCRLVEVGTTNRTRISDFRQAIDESTGLLLKVHPSNYRVQGFTDEASLPEMSVLARSHGLPLVFDAGSGLLDARCPWLGGPPPAWLAGEPGVWQSREAGADLVMFSGDKLLGGPQAGIIVGDEALISRLSRHPVARAMRIAGPQLAALTATLEAYVDNRAADLPFWRMATATYVELEDRCRRVAEGLAVEVIASSSTPGAGSVPGAEVASPVIALSGATDSRFQRLLHRPVPVVGRRQEGRLIIDLRSVDPADDPRIRTALEELWQ